MNKNENTDKTVWNRCVRCDEFEVTIYGVNLEQEQNA